MTDRPSQAITDQADRATMKPATRSMDVSDAADNAELRSQAMGRRRAVTMTVMQALDAFDRSNASPAERAAEIAETFDPDVAWTFGRYSVQRLRRVAQCIEALAAIISADQSRGRHVRQSIVVPRG
jgi:hypothetical protein